jgi:hypothetical protein
MLIFFLNVDRSRKIIEWNSCTKGLYGLMGLPHLPTARAVVYALMYSVYYYCSFFEKISVQKKYLQVQRLLKYILFTNYLYKVSLQ